MRVGCLSIAAAKFETVNKVYGLDISRENIRYSIVNGRKNNVSGKTVFLESDGFIPKNQDDRFLMDEIKGKTDFVLANPPSSSGDDGFGYRREILRNSGNF
jgi:methylase of polypeptide subunit release factors